MAASSQQLASTQRVASAFTARGSRNAARSRMVVAQAAGQQQGECFAGQLGLQRAPLRTPQSSGRVALGIWRQQPTRRLPTRPLQTRSWCGPPAARPSSVRPAGELLSFHLGPLGLGVTRAAALLHNKAPNSRRNLASNACRAPEVAPASRCAACALPRRAAARPRAPPATPAALPMPAG